MQKITVEKKGTYEVDLDQNGFPVFTKKNIALTAAFVKADSSYSASEDEESDAYADSYAGILTTEKENFFSFSKPGKDSLDAVIRSLDAINSTHLSSEGRGGGNQGREKTARGIRNIMNLKTRLEQGDPMLVGEIAPLGGKNNFSFATKFCAYVCRYALGKDNFCIYDEVIQSVLPYYAYLYAESDMYKAYYKTVGKDHRNISTISILKATDDYTTYRALIDSIIKGINEQSGEEITYKTFDRMLWYSFKGQKHKVQKAMNLLPKKTKK